MMTAMADDDESQRLQATSNGGKRERIERECALKRSQYSKARRKNSNLKNN